MENPLRKQISSIMKDHKKRQIWYRIVTTLAVVVVFVTTYMLILPAITMENKAECGITEHQHDANCYDTHYEKEKVLACTTESLGVHQHTDACYDAQHKLICGYADFVIHQHDQSCYDADGNLVCQIPEHPLHVHTAECYQMQRQLICTQEESAGHTHTAECYTKEQGNRICGKEEHTHGEGCYDADGNLICEQEEHTHGDECYEWNDVLTCTIPESAGHTHDASCYQDVQVLVCEEPAELHTHTDACYKGGVLVCGKVELKEHVHTDECYKEEDVLVQTLVCDRVEHVHTDECYNKKEEASSEENASEESSSEEASSEAVSEVETTEEASSQVEESFIEESSTEENSSEEASVEEVSTEETSTEEASSQIEEASSEVETTEEVSSQVEESSIEETSEEALSEEESTEAETEEESSEEASENPIDDLMLDDMVNYPVALTSSNAKRMNSTDQTLSLTGSGTKYDANGNLYSTDLWLNFVFDTKKIKNDGLEYYFEYPEGIIVPDKLVTGERYNLLDGNGKKAGTYSFEKDSNGRYRVVIAFDQTYVEKAGEQISGHVEFSGTIDGNKGNQDGSITIKGSDGVELIIPKEDIKYDDDKTNAYDISITKSGEYKVEDGKLKYTVEVVSFKGTPGEINFEDIIKAENMELGTPEIKVEEVTKIRHYHDLNNLNNYYDDGSETTQELPVSSSYENGKISMKLPKLDGLGKLNEEAKTKEYKKYRVTYTYAVSNLQGKKPTANNTASVSSKDNKTTEVKDSATKKVEIQNEHTINKWGNFDKEKNRIEWTITVNSNRLDIAGSKLTDKMLASLAEGTDVKFDPDDGYEIKKDSSGKITEVIFKATAEDGTNRNTYKITYYTPAEADWENKTITNDAKFTPGDGSGELGGTGTVTIGDGNLEKSVGSAITSEDGKTIEIPWKVAVTLPKGGLKTGTIISDDPTKDQSNNSGASHYMTYDQICKWQNGVYWADGNGNRVGNGNLVLTDTLAEIQFTASDGNTYAYSEIIGNSDKFQNLTFTAYTIKLLQDLMVPNGATKLIFEYSTTADVSNVESGSTYKNTVQIGSRKADAKYEYKKSSVIKTDENNQTGKTSKVNEDGTLIWKIKTTLGSASNKLTVTDNLPEGVQLISIRGEERINNLSNISIAEDGTIYGIENNYYEVNGSYKNNTVNLVLGIKNGTPLSANATYTFVLTCKVDTEKLTDYESGKTYTFTNSATATDDKGSIGSTEQTQDWTEKKEIHETKVIDKSGSWDNQSRRVLYTIALNPDGKDIVASSDVLTLKDVFKYYTAVWANSVGSHAGNSQRFEVNAWLLPDTVKLYKATKQEDGTLVKGDLITDWSWTVETEVGQPDWQNATYNTSTIVSKNIPDSTPLILEYEYQIQTDIPDKWESASNINITNTATLEGTAYKDDQSQNDTKWADQDHSGAVTTEHRYTLYKVSKGNYGKVLQGAVFKLQKYSEDGYIDTGTTYTTDEDGKIVVKWQKVDTDYQYELNTLYRIIEEKAPDGYALPSPMQIEKNAVYFYFSSDIDKNNTLPEDLPKNAWDLTKASQVTYVENETENVQVDIQKKWMYTTPDGGEKYVAAWEKQIEVALYRKESTKDPADETKSTATLNKKKHNWSSIEKEEYPFGTIIQFMLKSKGDQYYVAPLPEIKWNEKIATPEEDNPASEANNWTHTQKYKFVLTEAENTLEGYGEAVIDIQTPTPDEGTLMDTYTLNAANNWRVSVNGLSRSDTNSDGEKVYYTYYIKEITSKEGVSVTYDNNNGITSGTITVTNKKPEPEGYVLPETGGTGTYWYTLGGLLLIAGASLLMYRNSMRKGGRRIW